MPEKAPPCTPLFRPNRRMFAAQMVALPVLMASATGAMADQGMIKRALGRILDALIPADETPSATDLRVDDMILAMAKGIENYPEMISAGLGWFEQTARQRFGQPLLDLADDDLETLISDAFAAPAQTLPAVFITRLRTDAMTQYYRHPQALAGLGGGGPIQPMGYSDYDKAPTHAG